MSLSGRPWPTLAAPLVVLALAGPASADYRESYRRGMEAIDHANWAEAARRMAEAAAEQPREGEHLKIYGMRFEQYLPHYYLGLAQFNSGNCDGALAAWATSESQGAIKGAGAQYKTLLKNRQACQQQQAKGKPPEKPPEKSPAGPDPAAVAQAVQGVEAQLSRAEDAGRALASLAASPELSRGWGGDAALGGSEKAARDLLAQAQAKLEAGRKKPDLAVLAEARELAARATQELDQVKTQANLRREAVLRAAAAKKTAEDLSHTPPTLAPSPPPGPGPGQGTGPGPGPGSSPGSGPGPPADLMAAARAYFSGDYRQAAEVLARPGAPASGRAGAQALLLRGAARYALYLMGGQQDQALQAAARADVEGCRKLDASLQPDPQFFSPRFRDFFSSGR